MPSMVGNGYRHEEHVTHSPCCTGLSPDLQRVEQTNTTNGQRFSLNI